MSAYLLDGKQLAEEIKKQLKNEVSRLRQETGRLPCVVNVMVGNNHAACAYANSQKRVAEQIGIDYQQKILDSDISQQDLIASIQEMNCDQGINGVLLHKPVARHIDYSAVVNQIDVEKDLEGVNIINIGKMLLGKTRMIPCTPAAVMEHIYKTGIDLRGKESVIVGHSEIVGKPLSLLLLEKLTTVTVCHIGTSEAGQLPEHVARADVLIVAVGRAGLIKGEWIKKGAVVIDVGINQRGDKVVGDVEFESAAKRASYITPVPGGVGPVTVVMLMKNALEAFKIQNKKETPL